MIRFLIYLSLSLLSVVTVRGQTIKFSPDFDLKSSRTALKFETHSFQGSIKAGPSILELNIKNVGRTHLSTQDLRITLTDITGRGIRLCTDLPLKFAPGDRQKIALHNCIKDRGLFFLETTYSSKAVFKEDAIFLKAKEWVLSINGEEIRFYTDI